ncbi:hypothetical protein KX816_04505 [Sphingosinicellaceae bacterium]|nr:hypothetical protein KX816_04505 [Sphingosinicellaceae bacterium]
MEIAAHWRLAPAQTAALLGLEAYGEGADFLLDVPDADAETRLRLVIDVARELDLVFPEDVLLEWLRDDEDGMETPLAFMSRGATELRAMRAAAAARHGT